MIDASITKDKVKLSMRSIDTIVSRSILKDNGYSSRILYAGPKDDESIVILRLLELVRGRYVLEQTVVNTHFKSVQTTLASLNGQKFHKNVSAEKRLLQLQLEMNPNILSAVSYARQITSRCFFNVVIRDHASSNRSYYRLMKDCYLKYRMKTYLSRRI